MEAEAEGGTGGLKLEALEAEVTGEVEGIIGEGTTGGGWSLGGDGASADVEESADVSSTVEPVETGVE